MLAEILSFITIGVVISHLILDILKERRTNNIDQQKLQLEQSKVGVDMITKLPDILESLFGNPLIKNPEELKTKIKEIKEAYKDFKV